MDTRARVLALLQEGKTKADIARELKISKPAIGKHEQKLIELGEWRRPGEAQPKAKEGQGKASQTAPPSQPAAQAKTNRRPPPPGPHGTAFKKGNPGGPGGPNGNDHAVTHGAHETIFAGALDADELAVYLGIDTGVSAQIEEEIRLLTIRELRMMNRIHKLRLAGDMTIVEQTEEDHGAEVGEEDGKLKAKGKTKRSWKSMGTLGQIQSIEAELTRVQEKKSRLLAVKIDVEKGKPPEEGEKDTFMAALNATAEDVWASQEETDQAEGDG
jgi:hypothetical protein